MNYATDATQYGKLQKKKPSYQPMIPNKNELNSLSPEENIFKQINPIAPVRSSQNWATEVPHRGFDESDLNTYVIRPADKQEISLFDRFILGDASKLFQRDVQPEKQNLGHMMASKLSKHKGDEMSDPPSAKRARYRETFRGKNYGGVSAMHMK